ncbi:hypothetical protein HJG60_008624 [Phyllostomus discolor]|uniref:Uncharacterized protein n=1 Tax=Phyllostomus discolor TaxID=89673 RepID=A0A833Z1D0_9CHIR|nr:hypothetical protein HJG60_008624 [Phyllostomus discolor]
MRPATPHCPLPAGPAPAAFTPLTGLAARGCGFVCHFCGGGGRGDRGRQARHKLYCEFRTWRQNMSGAAACPPGTRGDNQTRPRLGQSRPCFRPLPQDRRTPRKPNPSSHSAPQLSSAYRAAGI